MAFLDEARRPALKALVAFFPSSPTQGRTWAAARPCGNDLVTMGTDIADPVEDA